VIVIDSSVWIDHFNGAKNVPCERLAKLLQDDAELLIGDLILQEVLQGFAADEDFGKALSALSALPCVSVLTPERAVAAAQNYRRLRAIGITVRKATDVAIATFCIEERHVLLHNDRDFDPFEKHLGLRVQH
jgi:predicted nucleic acid-binding protein